MQDEVMINLTHVTDCDSEWCAGDICDYGINSELDVFIDLYGERGVKELFDLIDGLKKVIREKLEKPKEALMKCKITDLKIKRSM